MKNKVNLYDSMILPNQKTSYKEKLDPDWYMATCDYYINKASGLQDIRQIEEDLQLAQGIIPTSVYDYVNSQLTKFVSTDKNAKSVLDSIPESIKQDDIITPIRNRYIGEFMAQPNHYNCTVGDSDIMMKINSKLKAKIAAILSQKLLAYLKGVEEQQQEASPESIEKLIKDEKRKYLEEKAIESKHFLDEILRENRVEELNNQLFYYMFANYMPVVYFNLKENHIGIEVVPPTEALRIRTNNNLFIEDDDAFVRREVVTISKVLEHQGDFEPKDLEEVRKMLDENSTAYARTPAGISTTSVQLKSRFMTRDSFRNNRGYLYNLFDKNKDSTIQLTGRNGEVARYHVVWRTEIEINVLKYLDDNGEVQEMEVPKDYKLIEEAGDLALEPIIKQEFWEIYRYGDSMSGVYTIPKPILVQRDEFSNHRPAKSCYNGMTSVLNDYNATPIARKICKLVALREIINIQLHREISKFKGYLNLIPEGILSDSEEFTQLQRLEYMYKDNTLIFNESEADVNVLQALRSIGNNAQGEYILALYNIRDRVKQEAREAADMNPERFGDIDTRGGKAVTENAIQRIATGSIPMFVMFDLFLERVYQAIIDYARLVYVNGMKLAYTNPDGKLIEVNVEYEDLLYREIGIHVTKNYVEKYRLDKIREAVLMAAANASEFGIMGQAITSDNTKELEKYLRELQEVIVARQSSAREEEAALQQQVEEIRAQLRQEEMEHEKDLENIKGDYLLEAKYIDAEVKLASLKSTNTEGENDYKELELKLEEMREQFNQRVKLRELAQRDRELSIKEKEIKSKERIAKSKKTV